MNYLSSIQDFFRSPKWLVNMLLAGLCGLIPVIGPIVVIGWMATGFWGRDDESPERFPEFEFGKFVRYLERGVWPFLVALATSLAAMIVMWILVAIVTIPLALVVGSAGSGRDAAAAGGVAAGLIGLISSVLYLVMMIGMFLVVTPLVIRAILLQDFVGAFNLAWVKRFVGLMWMETLISALFLWVASIVLGIAGMLMLCVGIIFATVLLQHAWAHLGRQLYKLFLARGGEAVPASPKLDARASG